MLMSTALTAGQLKGMSVAFVEEVHTDSYLDNIFYREWSLRPPVLDGRQSFVGGWEAQGAN
jgi:hypothetical protein